MNKRFFVFSGNYFNFALRNYKCEQEIIFRKNTTIVPNDKSPHNLFTHSTKCLILDVRNMLKIHKYLRFDR